MHLRHDLTRRFVVTALPLLLVACSQSHEGPEGSGVCCPVTDFTGCFPGSSALPGGGWAERLEDCTYTISGHNAFSYHRVSDEHGCARVEEDFSMPVCGGPDAGPPPLDAGPAPLLDAGASACDGLAPADCLGAGCVPTFHDSCCSSCVEGGGCADCIHWEPWACETFAHACQEANCATAADGACVAALPSCNDAHVNAVDACDVPGCVPAYPSGEGEPDPSTATCASIHPSVCTVACRRVAPPCPTGTVPEGDGFCYTDRCIPAFVCE